MTESPNPEELWSRLLSEEPELIRAAWRTLNREEREIVRSHLQAMARDTGWQTGQRRSAQAALECLDRITKE